MFLTASNLDELSFIRHGFFTRNGGVSQGLYASLNCGPGSLDDVAHVIANRARVAETLRVAPTHLCSLYQVHGNQAITLNAPVADRPKADAMVTCIPGIALGVLAADCVPVLFADDKARVIGAAHSGWKGAVAGILQATVRAMQTLGAAPSSIRAAIGPAIAAPSYEVSNSFREAFLARGDTHMRYFVPSINVSHFLFDLKAYVRDILVDTGITNINQLENDTYIEEDRFFSYRRATHRGEPDYGRQISAIVLHP